jgi:hypothetical protein
MINYKNRNELEHAYEEFSIRDIAIKCKVSAATIRYYLKKFKIKTRSISEGMLKKSDHISTYTAKYWADPKHKKQQSENIKQLLNTKYTKQQRSEWAQKNWQKNRKALSEGIRKSTTKTKKNKISKSVKKTWTPNRKKQQRKIAKALWQNQSYSIKTIQAIQKATNSEQFKAKVSKNSKAMWANSTYRQKQAKSRSLIDTRSILDKVTTKILRDLNIDAKPISLGPWTFDVGFTYNNRNILIECQGQYWHSIPEVQMRDKQKKTYYNKYLSNEYELFYIYEHEFYGLNKIAQIIDKILDNTTNIDFEFNELKIGIIDKNVANEFFNKYHYLSKGRSGLHFGASLHNILIAGITYTSVTRKQTADRLKLHHREILELHRLCIHPSYHKKNFASWLIARSQKFIPEHIKTLIAFSDKGAGHSGTVYKAAGWQQDGETKPSYWYVDKNGVRYYKKSVWDQAKRIGVSENEYANANGLCKIKGDKVLRFIKHL